MLRKFSLLFVLVINITVSSHILQAQENAEERFTAARKMMEKGNLDEALKEITSLSRVYPQNTDFKIYLGRIHAWKGNYATSENILDSLYIENPQNKEIYEALLNTLLWSGQSGAVLQLADEGLLKFEELSSAIQLVKLKVLLSLKKKREGLQLLDKLKKEEGDSDALQYLHTAFLKLSRNQIGLQFINTNFTNQAISPWQLATFSYLRNWERSPTEFKVNYGNIAGSKDLQVEAESYPKLGEAGYLYANVGLSSGNIFPDLKGGLEYFHSFRKGLSASGGARYMQFNQQNLSLYIFTGHINKLYQSVNYQYRPYFSFQSGSFFPSHTVMVRKNWFKKESFLQLDLQYGRIPYFLFISGDFDRVTTSLIGAQYQCRFAENWFLLAGFFYEYEEYSPENFRNRISSSVKISRRF